MFFEAGIVSTIQGKIAAFRIHTDIAVKQSTVRWAGSDIGIGPSLTLALGTGTGIKHWEFNFLLPSAELYFLALNFRGRSFFEIEDGTFKFPGISLVYYFPEN